MTGSGRGDRDALEPDPSASPAPREHQRVGAGTASPRPAFAHASEAELARILDFYDVRWAYEPDTFPIGWSLDGEVVESFSPDFYLPDLDIYVELTTLKQSLVRKKNRKLRRLRELYPDVRIKLFYARDFRQLLLKFGRLALAAELTGTEGQATPPRASAPGADAGHVPVVASGSTRRMSGEDDDAPEAPGRAARGASVSDADVPAIQTADPGRTARGRRRGHRHRAALRAAAEARAAAGSGPRDAAPTVPRAGVTPRAPGSVPSAGILPG